MPKPILVGVDPRTGDRAPLRFGVAASRFTGAPLFAVTVYAAGPVVSQLSGSGMDEELAQDAGQTLDPDLKAF